MRDVYRVVLILLLGSGVACVLYAQPEPFPSPNTLPRHLKFDHAEDHLFDQIRGIFQDHEGYLWLGHNFSGLFRYDGYEKIRFVHDPDDPASLSSNEIWAVFEDRAHQLWIGTRGGGLNRFDRQTGTFIHYRHDPGLATSISNDTVNVLLEDRQGNFWVGTNRGLNRFDRETGTFTHYRHDPNDSASLSHDWVGSLLETHDGTLWVGSWGLNRFDPETSTFTRYPPYPAIPEPTQDAAPNWVWAIHEDPQGRLWVGTWGGSLFSFDRETETFTSYPHDPSRPLPYPNDGVLRILDDPAGGLWLGTRIKGLVWFDPETDLMKTFQPDPLDPYSISSRWIVGLYADRQGVLWVGSFDGDLDRLDRASKPFEHIYARPGDPNSLASKEIGRPIYEGPDGMLWVTTNGCSLDRLDRVNDDVRHFRPDPDDPYSLQGCPTSVMVEPSGTVWVGGIGVLSRMEPDRPGHFNYFRHDPEDPASLPAGGIRGPYQDTKGRLWVGSNGFGLSRLDDRDRGVFTHFPLGDGIGGLNSIYEDHRGILWMGTMSRGLFRFDPENETFENYQPDPGNPGSISSSMVFGICERPQEPGIIWVATHSGGLNRFDVQAGTFTHLTVSNSDLPDNGTQGVLCDEEGRIWVSSDMGLSRYDPDTGTFKNFGLDDGLQSLEFVSWAYHKSPYTGEMFFGGANGLNAFFPDEIKDNPNPPQVDLRGLRLFNKPVKPGPASPLRASLSETEVLTLRHDQNDLTLEYVGLHFRHPEGNQYAYRLVGFDEGWREVGTQREATYTGLSPGNYTFRVKASNSDGVWNEEGASLRITILPPWWRTWWAYLLYGLLVMAAATQAYRWQHARIVHREQEKAHHALEAAYAQLDVSHHQLEEAHQDLEQTHQHLKATQAQLVQSEKMASLGQLTAGIAHEIKNPLNFVNNFAEVNEELADELREALANGESVDDLLDDLKQNAQVIAQHGKRADSIVQSMMQHASGGTGQREPTDINALVREYIDLAYHGKRAQNPDLTVEITRELGADVGSVEVVPQEIGRVLLNLLGNAFDAVHERADPETGGHGDAENGYVPTVIVSTRRNGEAVEIRVEDNGPGIVKHLREKIFEPFFTTKPTGSGTGLGLSLAYDIVTQGHGGRLTVESEEGKGATFIVTLPGIVNRTV